MYEYTGGWAASKKHDALPSTGVAGAAGAKQKYIPPNEYGQELLSSKLYVRWSKTFSHLSITGLHRMNEGPKAIGIVYNRFDVMKNTNLV